MENKYLLSICIPTRNRPKELSETLGILTAQINAGKYSDLVQIFVSDNTDNEALRVDMRPFAAPNVKYASNATNLGYARNVNSVIKNADGKYAWLLSDDDAVLDGAVESIVTALRSGQEINYLTFATGAAFQGKVFSEDFYFKDLEKEYFEKGSDFLAKYWITVIFISDNVFDREKLIAHAQENGFFENVNDVFQNSLMGISFIEKYGCVKVLRKTLLIDNYGKKAYSRFTAIDAPVHQYIKLWVQLRPCVGGEAIRQFQKGVESNIIRHGLRFVVHRNEINGSHSYLEDFRKISVNKELPRKMRALALFVVFLLSIPKPFSRLLVRGIALFKFTRIDYSKMKAEALQFEAEQQEQKERSSY